MNCPHFKEGRCTLAERLATRELGIAVECPVGSTTCQRCPVDERTEKRPSLQLLALVSDSCPAEVRGKWVTAARGIRARNAPAPHLASDAGPQLFAMNSSRPKSVASSSPAKPRRPGVGSTIARFLRERWSVTADESCGCTNLINEYDRKGPDWCETHVDEVAGKLLAKAKAKPGVHRVAPDWASRIYLRSLVTEAIETVRQTSLKQDSTPCAG